jgi:hypothetical protein
MEKVGSSWTCLPGVSINLNPKKYICYPIILSLIIIYGLWGRWYLNKK